MAPLGNSGSNTVTFLAGFFNNTRLESLEFDTMAILSLVQSGLASSLFTICSVMWAAVQYKVVSRLTAALAGIRWGSLPSRLASSIHSFVNGDSPERIETKSEGEDEAKKECETKAHGRIWSYVFCYILHLAMYAGYINTNLNVASPDIQIMIISSLPLAMPHRFYSRWPVVSTGLLMCWGQLWLQDVYLWLIVWCLSCMMLPFSLIWAIHFSSLVANATRLPSGQRWQYFRDNFLVEFVLPSLPKMWKWASVFWPMPTF